MNTWVVHVAVCLVSWSGEPASTAYEVTPDHAARLYRIQVYDTFRLQRDEFDRRRELGDQLLRAYEKSEQSEVERAAVVRWFAAAREASLPGATNELPPIPESLQAAVLAEQESMMETVPVLTSGQERHLPMEATPTDAVTSMQITLRKGAGNTSRAPFLSKLIKHAIKATIGSDAEQTTKREPEQAAAATPVQSETEPEYETPELEIELPPGAQAATSASPVTTTPTSIASPDPANDPFATPAAPATTADAFNVDELFEPATTPAPPRQPEATSADPFAP